MNGTNSHLSEELLDAYSRGQLSMAEILAAEGHLANCQNCYALFGGDNRLETLSSFARVYLLEAEMQPAGCVPYEEIAAFVNNESVQPELVQHHLAQCVDCSDLTRDLRRIRSQIDWNSEVTPNCEHASPPNVPALVSPDRRSALRKVAAVAVAAMLLGMLSVTGLLTRQVANLRSHIAQVEQANGELRLEAARSNELRDEVARLKGEIAGIRAADSSGSGIADGSNAINDAGRHLVVDNKGNIDGLDSLDPSYLDLVRDAFASERVRIFPPKLPATRAPGVRLGRSGQEETFRLWTPLGVTVSPDRPVFRWEAVPGAEQYVVFIRDLVANDEIESEPTTSTHWTPHRPLARGHSFAWAVEAVKGGSRIHAPSAEAPEAKFTILESARLAELARARTASHGSHLVMAALYGRYGLVAEARAELRALRNENPRSQVVARLLKNSRLKRP